MKIPDLNCDLGEHESPTTTAELMRWIDSANIACGGHAGDLDSMKLCLDLAIENHVRIGVHPGLAEAGGRGQRFPSSEELVQLLEEQVLPFQELVIAQGATLHHIKLHGTLYHATDQDAELSAAYLHWCTKFLPESLLYVRSGGLTAKMAQERKSLFWNECFLDRAYESDGSLLTRKNSDAILSDPNAIHERLQLWSNQQVLQAHSGKFLPLACETFCLHSDTPLAQKFATLAKNFFANQLHD